MQQSQTFAQRQTMQMGGRMLHSISILGMSSHDLSEYLLEEAARNPFLSYKPPSAFVAKGGDDFDAVATLAADKPSLMAHVVAQIELSFSNATDRMIALHFAEALEPTGWLCQSVDTIAMMSSVPVAKALQVLSVLQSFEPAGLFAQSLSECLLIQARDADLLTWEVETLIRNLHLVGEGRTQELADLCDCETKDIPEIMREIRGLDPKPGLAYSHTPTPVFPPDLIAKRTEHGWTVELNRTTAPVVKVEEVWTKAEGDSATLAERRKALTAARDLAQALERRGDTLLRTGAVLVARQARFLEQGGGHLSPLTREDVAEELGMHASTISRAVSGRMIQTPTATLPLRAFFSRAVTSIAGHEAASRDNALDFVQRTVKMEDPTAPLSDDAIVALAKRSGLRIARRTVAKYRSTLGIASSYERRKVATAS